MRRAVQAGAAAVEAENGGLVALVTWLGYSLVSSWLSSKRTGVLSGPLESLMAGAPVRDCGLLRRRTDNRL